MFGDSHHELERFYKKYYKVDLFLRKIDRISNEAGSTWADHLIPGLIFL